MKKRALIKYIYVLCNNFYWALLLINCKRIFSHYNININLYCNFPIKYKRGFAILLLITINVITFITSTLRINCTKLLKIKLHIIFLGNATSYFIFSHHLILNTSTAIYTTEFFTTCITAARHPIHSSWYRSSWYWISPEHLRCPNKFKLSQVENCLLFKILCVHLG